MSTIATEDSLKLILIKSFSIFKYEHLDVNVISFIQKYQEAEAMELETDFKIHVYFVLKLSIWSKNRPRTRKIEADTD